MANDALEAVLLPKQQELWSLTRRQFVHEEFVKELDRATRGKSFRIVNDIVWLMLLDSRDALVLHLGSWVKSIHEPGGLIGQLQANHARAFPQKRQWSSGIEREAHDTWLAKRDDQMHAEAFKRLFSCTCDPYPTGAGFAAMRDEFARRTAPVWQDRSQNRAHPYETSGKKARAKMLDFSELRDAITFAESFLNDLSLVGCGRQTGFHDMNVSSSEETASDLVELLLLGSRSRITLIRGEQGREEYYELLHREHDALAPDDKISFNDATPGFLR
jgi:hypothetical protein